MTITPTGHWFNAQKEEVYFKAVGTLPRAGDVTATFHADRYVVHGGAWTEWRITCYGTTASGPKTLNKLGELVKPEIEAWLNGDEYQPSRSNAIAQCIARTAGDGMYGTMTARELLDKYSTEVAAGHRHLLKLAIEQLEAGRKTLAEVAGC